MLRHVFRGFSCSRYNTKYLRKTVNNTNNRRFLASCFQTRYDRHESHHGSKNAGNSNFHYFPVAPLLCAALWGKKDTQEQQLIKAADELYDKYEISQCYNMLIEHDNSESCEVLWRLARVTCEVAKYTGKKAGKNRAEERKALMLTAYEYIKRALEHEPAEGCFAAHKWYAILIDYTAEYDGTKARLQRSLEVRGEFEKAIELNPTDPTCRHLLGLWYYTFADLPSYQRYVASLIFAKVPEATFDQALEHFMAAEAMQPGFYSKNLLYIAKIYQKKNNLQLMEHYTLLGLRVKAVTVDDLETEDELMKLWKKIKGADTYLEKNWNDHPMFVKRG